MSNGSGEALTINDSNKVYSSLSLVYSLNMENGILNPIFFLLYKMDLRLRKNLKATA